MTVEVFSRYVAKEYGSRGIRPMKRAPLLLLLLCAFIPTLRGSASFAAEPEAPTLFGIVKLVVGTDSIEVTRNDSLEGLELIPGTSWSTDGVKSLTAKLGDTFTVLDRQHVSVVYKLLRITDGSATIEETQFASLPGTPEHRNDHTRHIRTYGTAAVDFPGRLGGLAGCPSYRLLDVESATLGDFSQHRRSECEELQASAASS